MMNLLLSKWVQVLFLGNRGKINQNWQRSQLSLSAELSVSRNRLCRRNMKSITKAEATGKYIKIQMIDLNEEE
jgi:hypothetical protein